MPARVLLPERPIIFILDIVDPDIIDVDLLGKAWNPRLPLTTVTINRLDLRNRIDVSSIF